jgi:hypothetical protein
MIEHIESDTMSLRYALTRLDFLLEAYSSVLALLLGPRRRLFESRRDSWCSPHHYCFPEARKSSIHYLWRSMSVVLSLDYRGELM